MGREGVSSTWLLNNGAAPRKEAVAAAFVGRSLFRGVSFTGDDDSNRLVFAMPADFPFGFLASPADCTLIVDSANNLPPRTMSGRLDGKTFLFTAVGAAGLGLEGFVLGAAFTFRNKDVIFNNLGLK